VEVEYSRWDIVEVEVENGRGGKRWRLVESRW
jgi:hypothetical protein